MCVFVFVCVRVYLGFWQAVLQMHKVVIVRRHIKRLKETFLWVSCEQNGISSSPLCFLVDNYRIGSVLLAQLGFERLT